MPAAPGDAPTLAWELTVGGEGETSVAAGVVVVLEPAHDTAAVSRIDTTTGEAAWSVDIPADGPADLSIDASGALAVVQAEQPGGSEVVTVLDTADGRTIWEHHGESETWPAVEPAGDLVVVRLHDETVAVDRATGEERWTTPQWVDVSGGALVVKNVLVDSDSEEYGVLDPETGEPLWRNPGSSRDSVFAVDGAVIYAADIGNDDTVSGYDATTGEERWSSTGLDVDFDITVDSLGDGSAVVSSSGSTMYALDLITGEVRWTAEIDALADTSTFRVDAKPYVMTSMGGSTTLVDASTGEAVGDLDSLHTGAIADGVVYDDLATDVVALELPGLDERWRAETEDIGHVHAVAGGFVIVDWLEDGHLVGFQAAS